MTEEIGQTRASGTGDKMKVYMRQRQGPEKQKRIGCRCEALDVSGLDKIRFKKKKLKFTSFSPLSTILIP